MIAQALKQVMQDYAGARSDTFTGHYLANLLRETLPNEIRAALGEAASGLVIRGSAGQGTWSAVPWVSVFDSAVTETAMRGYYVVYLFHAEGNIVHLSLNQGATATRAEFTRRAPRVLSDRARLMRERLPDYAGRLSVHEIALGSTARLPTDYEAAHALGVTYRLASMPTEEVLRDDLNTIVSAYRTLFFRGGLEMTQEIPDSAEGSTSAQLTEVRRYAVHRKIERNARASALAKKYHGLRCEACDLNFEERYGLLGKGYIEAHHLRPLSSLEEGKAVSYDLASDFAVLCANCHAMIHRPGAPSTLDELRKLLRS